MRVSNYMVAWRYTSVYNKQHDHDQEQTTCRITDVSTGVEYSATVKKDVADTSCKDKARKASLAKVLRNNNVFLRNERKEFWETYRHMKEEPRWLTKEERNARKNEAKAQKAEKRAQVAH